MSNTIPNNPFDDYPVIGRCSSEHKVALLREMGDDITADEFDSAQTSKETDSLASFRGGGIFRNRALKPWEHISHSFGFLPAGLPATNEPLPLFNAGQIEPDQSLRNAAVTIRLDKLRVADYPGKGTHRILFDFSARHATEMGNQPLHYNATLSAREGQEAPVLGQPIFVGLVVGNEGLSFACHTVNVANEGSQKALDMLESDLVKNGLKLAKTVQPAIGPLSQIAVGLTKSILGVHKNVRVQEFQLGLDFDRVATGARLALGAYFAVQVAEPWDWSQWLWHPGYSSLVAKNDSLEPCPYNYIVFRVSRHSEP
ncbi:MAG: hypothetical protein QNK37_11295 [Acidobacteriota bacterium]|nr:hypothetical protein [Acidobacteriota bacterium]